MDDRTRNRGRWTVVVIVVAAVVLLPLFYVLSSGPALWLAEHDWVDKSRLPTIYWPIGWGNSEKRRLSPHHVAIPRTMGRNDETAVCRSIPASDERGPLWLLADAFPPPERC